MPNKTNTELIRELDRSVNILTERVDYAQKELDYTRDEGNKLREETAKRPSAFDAQIAVIELQVSDLRKTSDESSRRWWSLLPGLIGAVIGASLAFLGQLLLSYLKN